MGKNLKQQMMYAIDSSFRPGTKKSSVDDNEKAISVFSYQYRDNLKDMASNFASYMREEHPEVRMLREVEKSHIDEFLEKKALKCSANTIDLYRSNLGKIGILASETYNSKIDMSSNFQKVVENAEKGRGIAMRVEDYNKLMRATEDRPCQSRLAIEVCREFGLRVSEVVKIQERDIKEDSIHIHSSKGGRDRDIEIRTDSQREVLEKLKEQAQSSDENIIKVQADSINKYLRENMEKIGIDDYSERNTGVHSIRKMYAEERYQEELDEGLNHAEAWGIVSEELGHSRDREDLFKVYCPDYQ